MSAGPIRRALVRRLDRVLKRRVADRRPPDVIIGGEEDPYLRRWWVIPGNKWFNIYLHHFMRSDDDRALHDHPWVNLSVLLDGQYLEHRLGQSFPGYRQAGDIVLRMPSSLHRVQLTQRWERVDPEVARCADAISGRLFRIAGVPMVESPVPVWTLFITGPRVREWGFLCTKGWRHWRDFTAGVNGERVGRGCDE